MRLNDLVARFGLRRGGALRASGAGGEELEPALARLREASEVDRRQIRELTKQLQVSRANSARHRQELRELRGGDKAPHSQQPEQEFADALLASGLLDAEYYCATAGKAEMGERDAAIHYVRHGLAAQLSPHPLIEFDYLPPALREKLRRGDIMAFLSYVDSEDAASRSWGPLFDPKSAGVTESRSALQVLRSLRSDDPLPVPAGFLGPVPTLGSTRKQALEHAVMFNAQRGREHHARPHWDVARERAFRANARALDTGPVVSVIMPTWNREDTVAAAIESVQLQRYASWELIVADDGSSDQTARIVQEIAASDPRVRLIARDHQGVSAARNSALDAASGEFIAFLDADNSWRPDLLSLSVGALITDPAIVATHAGMRIFGEGKEDAFRGEEVTAIDLLHGNSIDMNTFVARRGIVDAAGRFDEALRRWVDYDLIMRLSALGGFRYLPFIGCDYVDDSRPDRITTRESSNWQFVVMAKQAMDWTATATQLSSRVAGRVGVVTIAYQDHSRTMRAVNRVLETTEGADVEVVIVDNGSRSAVGRVLSSRFASHPRVKYVRLARNLNFATGSNVGFAHTTGEYVMFLNNDTSVKDGWLEPLLDRLVRSDAMAVQPLLLYPNGNIQTAGTIFNSLNGLATHFLHEHPPQDAYRHHGRGFSAITGGAMLLRSADFARLRGFDPIYANGFEDVDFCLRARESSGAMFEVEHRSQVVHEESKSPGRFDRETINQVIFRERWAGRLPQPELHQYADLGFSWSHMRSTRFPRPILSRPPRTVTIPGRGETPSFRWGLRIGASGIQDRWGDVPYADDLGRALTDLGQQVVITRHGGHNQSSAYLEDVTLTIRGAEPAAPHAGRINVLWVISRSERVTVEEVRSYDAVFAASPSWAAWMSEQSGRPVHVLLQATAPERFHPSVTPASRAEDVLFVGGPRLNEGGRPIVNAALDAGFRVGLWGGKWDEVAPPELYRGSFLPFGEAASHYRAAAVLLNDHMESMREWGFINNRTFDAVAAGVPVISDRLDGLDLFGGAVRAVDGIEGVVDALQDRSWIPGSAEMLSISERIRDEHSFARRAEVLLERAIELAPTLLVRP